MTVLVVEDNPQVRNFLIEALSEAGFVVDSADTGTAALDMLRRQPYSVALVDLSLPDMTGLFVAQTAHDAGCPTPMVAVSGVVDLIDRSLLTPAFAHVMAKPVRITKLVEFVRGFENPIICEA